MKRVLHWFALVATAYVLVSMAVWFFQDRLIFVGANWSGARKPLASQPQVQVETLAVEASERAGLEAGFSFRIAWAEAQLRSTSAAATDKPSAKRAVLLFFLGNGQDLASGVGIAATWASYGLDALIVEYPGYGASGGRPSQVSINAAAERAASEAQLRAKARGLPCFVGGVSLGTFSALHVARAGFDKVLLFAPPTSMVEAARRHYWWLPVGLLLRHRFDNLAAAASVPCPALVFHGTRDEVVPISMGRRVAAALGAKASFVEVAGLGHWLPLEADGPLGERIAAFLKSPG